MKNTTKGTIRCETLMEMHEITLMILKILE